VTRGNDWDVGEISYAPPVRMQKQAGLVIAAILVTVGAALLIVAMVGQQNQSQIRIEGDVTIGTVSSMHDGLATVEYGVGGERFSVIPKVEVTELSGIGAGSTVTVHFDPLNPGHTFIDRIDVLEPLTPLLVFGGVLLVLGLVFARFPPQIPERQRPF
jgi:hypothetical protein